MMKPPGSRPGINSLAITPTMSPKMIHPMIPNMRHLLAAAMRNVFHRSGTDERRRARWPDAAAGGLDCEQKTEGAVSERRPRVEGGIGTSVLVRPVLNRRWWCRASLSARVDTPGFPTVWEGVTRRATPPACGSTARGLGPQARQHLRSSGCAGGRRPRARPRHVPARAAAAAASSLRRVNRASSCWARSRICACRSCTRLSATASRSVDACRSREMREREYVPTMPNPTSAAINSQIQIAPRELRSCRCTSDAMAGGWAGPRARNAAESSRRSVRSSWMAVEASWNGGAVGGAPTLRNADARCCRSRSDSSCSWRRAIHSCSSRRSNSWTRAADASVSSRILSSSSAAGGSACSLSDSVPAVACWRRGVGAIG